ncbi:MAG: preprotein translocase subunit SecY, partial [Lachnospiraceae bacterium]|nr:preprotein translocase subunit SecY [Lachnospiraceae bacterium]
MLTTLKNAFKIKEIRQKLFFTFVMMVVIRIGSQLPVPGVNGAYFRSWFEQHAGNAFGFFDAITGGSFINMSLLALGINPYITSSIIMQLLTIAIPKLEEMQKDGEDGRKKIASITRYVTVALALIQGTAMSVGFGRQGLLVNFNALSVITSVAAMTAGSAFLMWIGERITENGVGNGIS